MLSQFAVLSPVAIQERGAQRESAPVMRGSAAGVNVDTGAVQVRVNVHKTVHLFAD